MKTLLFPRSRLSRTDMRERTDALSANLDELARERKIPVFSGEFSWYGLDPLHPRRRARGAIWQRLLAALASQETRPLWSAPARDDARRLRALHAEFWSREIAREGASAPMARLADGSTVALY